jgi:hypothetical protein
MSFFYVLGSMRRSSIVVAAFAVLAGCSSAPQPPADPPKEAFAARESFGDGIVARRVQSEEFAPRTARLHAGRDGTFWAESTVALDEYSGEGVALKHVGIARRQDDGHGTTMLFGPQDVIHHPGSDTFTIVRQDPPNGLATGYQLTRLSNSGVVLATVLFRPSPPAARTEVVEVADDGALAVTPSSSGPLASGVHWDQGVDDGRGGIFVLANVDGETRLLHLDADYRELSSATVLPRMVLPIRDYIEIVDFNGDRRKVPQRYFLAVDSLIVDAEGHPWIGGAAPAVAAQLLAKVFGKAVALADEGDIFVARFTPDLELESAVGVPAAGEQYEALLAAGQHGIVGVASWMDTRRDLGPNRSRDYGTFFGTVDTTGAILASVELEDLRDSRPAAIASCGEDFCVGGQTDTVWVDTGSQVENGKGLLVRLSSGGAVQRCTILSGARHTEILSVVPDSMGGVFLSAMTNAPITHTGDADPSLKFDELWLARAAR